MLEDTNSGAASDRSFTTEDLVRWRSEIRSFVEKTREELGELMKAVEGPAVDSPQGERRRGSPDSSEEPPGDGALERLGILKRRLTERIQDDQHQEPATNEPDTL